METNQFEGLVDQQARWLVRVEKPEGLVGAPADLGKRVYYYQGEVGGRQVLALIDSGKTRRLFIDLDGDGDLADEKPVGYKRVKSSISFGWSMAYRFGPLSFSSEAAPSASQYEAPKPASGGTRSETRPADNSAQLAFTAFIVEQFDLDYLLIRPAVCMRGMVRINGKSHAVFLTDANFNGRYDDAFKFPLKRARITRNTAMDSDLIALDVNRNGQIEYEAYGVSEMQPLTKLLQFQGGYYNVEVVPDGSSMTIEPARLEMGTLDLGQRDAELVVRSENGTFQVATRDGKCQLPAGTYRLWHILLRAQDDNKIEWTLRGQGSDSKPCDFDIQAHKTTALKVGAPLKMQTSQRSHRTLLSGRVVSFGASCVDQAGIEYQPGADRGRIRAPAPAVKIFDESGKQVSAGKFEYG